MTDECNHLLNDCNCFNDSKIFFTTSNDIKHIKTHNNIKTLTCDFNEKRQNLCSQDKEFMEIIFKHSNKKNKDFLVHFQKTGLNIYECEK